MSLNKLLASFWKRKMNAKVAHEETILQLQLITPSGFRALLEVYYGLHQNSIAIKHPTYILRLDDQATDYLQYHITTHERSA